MLIAAENGALPGGKVGGVGDVIRDLPLALADLGWRPTVLMPAYGSLHLNADAALMAHFDVDFAGSTNSVALYDVIGADARIRHWVLEHVRFSPQGAGKIYCDDGASRPFATDANKFAFFCAAAATYVAANPAKPDVVHLHDWHTGIYCALRQRDARFAELRKIRTVFTIHNLAMQGIRPLSGDESSFEVWFPDGSIRPTGLTDPRYPDCVNPMAAAIRLADKINTVSPSYAEEILRPNDAEHGFHGSEGLELDLRDAVANDRLIGILNGCQYPKRDRSRPSWRHLKETIERELDDWWVRNPQNAPIHDIAVARIGQLADRRPDNLLVSIGRLTEQKVALFLQKLPDGSTALQAILGELRQNDVLILLGSGDPALEQAFAAAMQQHSNFLFLCGYSETFSDMLYAKGDLFLMPSSFEPCGISQMLAMRSGQPCVVHAVGGLKDTVTDNVNGFTFTGATPAEQAANFVASVSRAVSMRSRDRDRWLKIREAAAAARFSWTASTKKYIGELYEPSL